MSAFELNNTVLKNSANLKAYYRFESGALTTDSSGNGKTLTNNNSVASASGVFGGSASLGATNSTNKCFTVNTSPISGSNAPFTLIGWFKFNAVANNAYFINTSETATDTFTRFDWHQPTSVLRFYRVRNGIGQDGPTYSFTPTVGTWYHLAMTYNGSKIYGYVNGSVVATGTSTGNGSVNQPFDGLCIGSDPQSETTSTSTLDYDDLAVFNTALTSDQIKELYEGRTVGELWPQNGLVGLWHLNGNSTDYSPNGYNLTNNGSTPFVNGKFGQAGSFNGSSQSFSILNASCPNLNITGSQTWMCWFNASVNNSDRAILSKHDGTNYRLIQINPTAGITAYFSGLTTNASISSDITVATNKWYFVAWIYDSTEGKIKLWINMTKKEATASGTTSSNSGDFFIGKERTQWFFSGLIDEAAIFNRALSDREIRNYYAWATGRFGNIA